MAQQLGITRRTVYNWLHDLAFKRALNRLRRELWSQALDRLRTLVHPSLNELETQLRNGNEKARYRSANALLRHASVRKAAPVELSEEEDQDDDIENE